MLDALRADGVRRIVLLTGDRPAAAAAVAEELDITEFHAQGTPERKQDLVRELRTQGYTVALVGDDLRKLAELRDLGRRGVGLIREN